MKKGILFFFIGIILILLYYFPFFINGDNSYFRIHDLMEQDFVYVKLNAKYLFHPFVNEIPELFGGTFRGSIQGHSLLQIFLYKLVQGSLFLKVNQILISLLGFIGMYLLQNELFNKNKENLNYFICFLTSFLFSIIPLLLHGATLTAMPLVLFLLIKMYREKAAGGGIFK